MEAIVASRVVAVLRAEAPNGLAAAACALVESGIGTVEFALTTPGALDVLETFCESPPAGACVGAGTVLTADDARAAVNAGASFLVMPSVVPSAIEAARECGVPVIAGALTPTEIVLARQAGATAVKIFPAALGGPRYLRLLRDPFPEVPFVPTGGIGLDDAPTYLRAGAVAVGIGSSLVGEALRHGALDVLRHGALDVLRARAKALVAAISALALSP